MATWDSNWFANNLNITAEQEFQYATNIAYVNVYGVHVMNFQGFQNVLIMLRDKAYAKKACIRMMAWLSYLVKSCHRYKSFIDERSQAGS